MIEFHISPQGDLEELKPGVYDFMEAFIATVNGMAAGPQFMDPDRPVDTSMVQRIVQQLSNMYEDCYSKMIVCSEPMHTMLLVASILNRQVMEAAALYNYENKRGPDMMNVETNLITNVKHATHAIFTVVDGLSSRYLGSRVNFTITKED